MKTITVEAEVEVDLEDALDHLSVEDIEAHLRDRRSDKRSAGGSIDENDPLQRIWQEVVRYGRPLEEVVEDLMRERQYSWRLAAPPMGHDVAGVARGGMPR